MTPEEYQNLPCVIRRQKKILFEHEREADPGPEKDLQSKAEKWLTAHGFPFIHDRSKGKNRPGQILDLHAYLPKGRHVVIEFKTGRNCLTPEQKQTRQKLIFLGHEFYECRSFRRFLEIMNGC